MLGRIAGPLFGDYQAAFRFGQVGYELVEARGLKRFQASIYMLFAIWIARGRNTSRSSSDLLRRSFEAANKIGDLTFATYASLNEFSDGLFAGYTLSEVQRKAEVGLAFMRKARFGLVTDAMTVQLGADPHASRVDAEIRLLRRMDSSRNCPFERHLAGNPALAITECWYWIRKSQARYFAGAYKEAIELPPERSSCSGPQPPSLRRPNITFTAHYLELLAAMAVRPVSARSIWSP